MLLPRGYAIIETQIEGRKTYKTERNFKIMKTIHLQQIGKTKATEAKNLKVGDVTVWNGGATETITSIEFTKTKKSVLVGIEYINYFGQLVKSVRRFGAERLVGIK